MTELTGSRFWNHFQWIIQRLFSCNHFRMRVSEGKCYCPDCGRGLIYRWVALRCAACHSRLESQTILQNIIPKRRHCSYCGERSFEQTFLESPAYFQLHKAQLVVTEEFHEQLDKPYIVANFIRYAKQFQEKPEPRRNLTFPMIRQPCETNR